MDCFSSMFFREHSDSARNDQKVPKALEESFHHYALAKTLFCLDKTIVTFY